MDDKIKGEILKELFDVLDRADRLAGKLSLHKDNIALSVNITSALALIHSLRQKND